MAFEDCEAVTLDVCTDCVQHLANGEGGCCHEPHHGDPRPYYVLERLTVDPLADRPCATGVRLERKWRRTDITLGCADDDCTDGCRSEDGSEPWFSWSDCEGCGSPLGGDRQHATAWVRRDPRPERVIVHRGWLVVISPFSGGGLYAVATHADSGITKSGPWTPRSGAERWQQMAAFVATLPA